MSLTAGTGPLGQDRAGAFSPTVEGNLVYVEPHPRRIQAVLGDRTLIDTEGALMVHRRGQPLSYAFAAEDVSELPTTPVLEAPGFVSVPWTAVDAWFEEGRRLVHYPPNPYHRVDCRPTRRRLRVKILGVTVVDTADTTIVFETSLAPRLYVSVDAVRTDVLRRSDTSTYCNYKGWATYWSAVVGDVVVPDVAWSYEDPLPESSPIASMVSFDPDRAAVQAELPHGRDRYHMPR